MNGAEFLVDALKREGVDRVFVIPGGLVNGVVVALLKEPAITPVVAAHEGGAAAMADGYARTSGRMGVCLTIGGPGAGNAVTAIAAARTDHSPVLLITGDVPTRMQGRGAFQEASPTGANDADLLRAVTEFSQEIATPQELLQYLRLALRAMHAYGKGPVHLTIPLDVQAAEAPEPYDVLPRPVVAPRFLDAVALEAGLRATLDGAVNIAILAGTGCVNSGAAADLLAFAEAYEVPVATTFRAKGVFPEDHRLSLGMFGYAGTHHAISSLLADDLDAVLVLGSSLSQQTTLCWSHYFKPKNGILQVDINPRAIGRNFPVQHAVLGDCRQALKAMASLCRSLEDTVPARREWLDSVRAMPRWYDMDNLVSDARPIAAARVLRALRSVMPRNGVLAVDSGAHRAFAGHYWEAYEPGAFLCAAGIAPMGWAIPAGIGAKLARPDRPCAVFTGDGCMLMHGMEIHTAARYGVPVLIIVNNNGALGNLYLRAVKAGPEVARLVELPVRDWVKFAQSVGADGARVEDPRDLTGALERGLNSPGPFVVDVHTDKRCPTPVGPWAAAFAKAFHDF